MTTEAAEVTLRLNIPYLYTYWLRAMEPTTKFRDEAREWDKENTLLSGLRLNLLEAHRFLYQPDRPSFEAFEEWVLAINGGAIDEPSLTRLRDALDGKPVGSPAGNLDAVAGLKLTPQTELFGGERDALRSGRRTEFGLQLQF